MNNRIEIPISKKKLTFMLIGSLVFVSLGLWFLISPPTSNHRLFGNPTLIFAAGISATLFFGLCFVYLLKKIPDKTPGLIIDNDGILDNSSGVSAGFIPWADIKG